MIRAKAYRRENIDRIQNFQKLLRLESFFYVIVFGSFTHINFWKHNNVQTNFVFASINDT